MTPWTFVSPASRGIGHEIARHLLQTTNVPVVVTARTNLEEVKSSLLKGLGPREEGSGKDALEKRLHLHHVDVLDDASISSLSESLKSTFPPSSHRLQLAFLLPGRLDPERTITRVSASSASLTFQTNILGPLLLAKHLFPFLPTSRTSLPPSDDASTHLPRTSTIAFLAARVGSISDNRSAGGWYSYRMSKAAIFQLAKTLDLELRRTAGDRAMAVALHPGTVRTGL
ncbi:short-chain dehydrogenase/reductase-like protein, partial [Eremomyces bilateralis CBS 781.70]